VMRVTLFVCYVFLFLVLSLVLGLHPSSFFSMVSFL